MFALRLALFGLIAFLLFWLTGFMLFTLVSIKYPTNTTKTADVAIVLTGGPRRIETGLHLLANGQVEKIFITGVNENTSMSNIRGRYDGDYKLPNCCITLGRMATSTVENASESQKWIELNEPKTLFLVTSSYHMPRALMEFKAENDNAIKIMPLAVPYKKGDFAKRGHWRILWTEYHKTLYRWVGLRLPI